MFRSTRTLPTTLLISGPAAYAVIASATRTSSASAVAGALLISLAGLTLRFGRRAATLVALLGSALLVLASYQFLLSSPALVLLCGVTAIGVGFAMLSAPRDTPAPEASGGNARSARAATAVALGAWVLIAVSGRGYELHVLAAAGLAVGLALARLGIWAWRVRGGDPARALTAAVVLGLSVPLGALLWERPVWAISAWALLAFAVVLFVRDEREAPPLLGEVLEHPARLVVATFAALSICGSVLLALPASSAGDEQIGFLDAAFTAVSATCVTGLVVVDTGSAFSVLGQGVVLVLIQVGGLGIMTFYTVALGALGRRLSLRHELAVAGAASIEDQAHLFRALGRVLVVTFVFEAIGAAILFLRFAMGSDSIEMATWRAVFTSISAFCNAGFALQPDSLISYNHDPAVLNVVGLLIVAGGLSPAVVLSLPAMRRGRVVPLQNRLILTVSAVLLVGAFVSYLAFEWSHSLEGLSFLHKLDNAWFQSITLRTAGFNSVDLTRTQPVTQAMMNAMMFVGGSPGGTSGGIKTTTVALLLLAVVAALRGRPDATAFGRRVDHASVYKAAAVATIGVLSVLVAVIAVLLTQSMPANVALFEVVSALATVGLSLGGTAELDEIGKILIMICMFVGRIGPLTLFLFLMERRMTTPFLLPDEQVDVG